MVHEDKPRWSWMLCEDVEYRMDLLRSLFYRFNCYEITKHVAHLWNRSTDDHFELMEALYNSLCEIDRSLVISKEQFAHVEDVLA